jgi:hypothetical protein
MNVSGTDKRNLLTTVQAAANLFAGEQFPATGFSERLIC